MVVEERPCKLYLDIEFKRMENPEKGLGAKFVKKKKMLMNNELIKTLLIIQDHAQSPTSTLDAKRLHSF